MKKIIFTDLDGTLTLKDTYTKFVLQNLKISVILNNISTLWNMWIDHRTGKINDDDVKKITFRMFFMGYDKDTNIGNFAKEIPWNTKVIALIEAKREEGYKVIIVTASPDVYVRHVCAYLGYDGFISTQTLDDGKYLTGELNGEVCNFGEKPKRILEFLEGQTPQHTISYGNSSGDFEMLRWCDESYFVNKLNIKRFQD